MIKTIYAWDLGATKCRAGIIEYDTQQQDLTCKKHYSIKLKEATSLEDLIEQIETHLGMKMADANAICIGAAGQYDGNMLNLHGAYPYPMHFAKIAKAQNWPPFSIIHDYAPIVCATFTSYMDNPKNIVRLNNRPMNPYGRRVALGIGTGLGLKDGVLFQNGDFWLGENEIGHIGITTPPRVDFYYRERHEDFLRFLHDRSYLDHNQSLTFEKILSGLGTVRLYQFFYPDRKESTPETVALKMREGKAKEMVDTFAWYAGLFIGTVQLTFMPEGGIFITGGVAIHYVDIFHRPEFRRGIHASPAYMMQRETYPLRILSNHEHALFGSGYYAVKRLLVPQALSIHTKEAIVYEKSTF